MRRSEWRRYWGDFIEASLAKGGWPDKCLDNVVDYGWQQEYMRFMFILMDTNGEKMKKLLTLNQSNYKNHNFNSFLASTAFG